MPLTCENTEYTPEMKEQYRKNCRQYAYDKALTARNIIADAYHKAYPHALRRFPRDGICHCQNPIEHGEITLTLDEKGHEYHNHQNCKSWACPICAPKRAYARAKELEKAFIAANKLGYKQFFVTFTVPHRKSHTSRHVIKLLNDAYRRFTNTHAIRRLKAEYDYIGAIKCLDYTITDNGTHAHLHTIWMFDFDADIFDLAHAIASDFLKVWDRQVYNLCGKHINHGNGFHLECMELGSPDDADAEAIARYAAKSISIYCSDKDKSKEGSITPFDLLNSDATPEQHAQYADFYKGQKGRRHIMFTPGLKEHLGITDDEEEERPAAAVIAHLKYAHAYYLKDEAARQEFEARAAVSVADAVDWLESETRRQQSEIRRRFLDPTRPDLPQNLDIVREKYAIKDLDEQRPNFDSRIKFHNERQDRFREWATRERHTARSYSPPPSDWYDSPYDWDAVMLEPVYTRRRPSGLGIAMAKADKFAPSADATIYDGAYAHVPHHPLVSPPSAPIPGTFGEDLFMPFAPPSESENMPRSSSRVESLPSIPCPFDGSASDEVVSAPCSSVIDLADVADDADADFWF